MSTVSKSSKKRSFLTPLCIFAAILLVLVLVITLVFCLPLKSLGLSDKVVLNGKTVAEMKLENTSIGKLLPLANSLRKDNSHLVNNAPASKDFHSTESKFWESSANQLGHIQYSNLIYKDAVFRSNKTIIFTDKQLAVVLQRAVAQAPTDKVLSTSADLLQLLGSRALKDVLECLETFNVTVEQVALGSKGKAFTFEVLLSFDISQFISDVQLPVLGALQSRVYVKLNYTLDVNDVGRLQLSNGKLSVNGKNAKTSGTVLDALLIALNDDENSKPHTSQTFVDGIAVFVQVVFGHIGDVGIDALHKGTCGIYLDDDILSFVPNTGLFDWPF